MPPHFIIDKYFSEQSSCKAVALQAFSAWIRAVAAAQASARVAARRRLRSQRRRIFLVARRRSALATQLFIFVTNCGGLASPRSDSLDA